MNRNYVKIYKFSSSISIFSDDLWTDAAAKVVCRMLGLGTHGAKAMTNSYFGIIGSNFGLDNVQCSGHESDLTECSHHTEHDCRASEAAGVMCGTQLQEETAGWLEILSLTLF